MRQPAAKRPVTVTIPANTVDHLRNERASLDVRTFLPSSWDANHELQPGVTVDLWPRERLDDNDTETFISLDWPGKDGRRFGGECVGRLGERDAVDLALFILANVPARARRWSRA